MKKIINIIAVFAMILSTFPVYAAAALNITGMTVTKPMLSDGTYIESMRDIIATFSSPAKDVSLDVYDKLTLGLVGNYIYKITPTSTQKVFALSVSNLNPSKTYRYVVYGRAQSDNSQATKEGFFTTDSFAVTIPTPQIPLQGLTFNSLIKGDEPAVYYYANDGKRYVFTDSKVFLSWFSGFLNVNIIKITKEQLASIPLGGLVTMRPGSLIKIESDPKVYIVDVGGLLRLIETESMAVEIGGINWAKNVTDIAVSFFTNYKYGSSITSKSQYIDIAVFGSLININQEKGL